MRIWFWVMRGLARTASLWVTSTQDARVVGWAIDAGDAQVRIRSEQCDLRCEVEVLVGDMEGEDAAGGEVNLVEGHGLRGEQVERDGVAGEGVDDQDVEPLWRLGGEGGAGVAF